MGSLGVSGGIRKREGRSEPSGGCISCGVGGMKGMTSGYGRRLTDVVGEMGGVARAS